MRMRAFSDTGSVGNQVHQRIKAGQPCGRTRRAGGPPLEPVWSREDPAATGRAFLHLFGYLDGWSEAFGGRLRVHVLHARRLAAALVVAALLSGWTAASPAQPAAGGATELALSSIALLGVPYRFGSDDPAVGLDCSGLVRFVVRSVLGVQLPRQAEAISRTGAEVDRTQLEPGDLVFFNTLGRPFSHVGVYLGADQFVHAPATRGQVRIEQISQPYWQRRFNGARRLDLSVRAAAAEAAIASPVGDLLDGGDPPALIQP